MRGDPAERAWQRLSKLQRLRVLVNLKGSKPGDLLFARLPWLDVPATVRDRFRVMLSVHFEITKALGGIQRDMRRIEAEADAAYQRSAAQS